MCLFDNIPYTSMVLNVHFTISQNVDVGFSFNVMQYRKLFKNYQKFFFSDEQ